MQEIPIIDTHLHLCNQYKFQYRWLELIPNLNTSYFLEDYNRATAALNIDGMIFMEYVADSWEQSVEEAIWVYELSQSDHRIKGIIARAPLHTGERCRGYLERLKANPLVKGIRQVLQSEPLDFCLKPKFIEGIKLLSEYDWFGHICITHKHMPFVNKLIEKCPDVQFVLDHMGKPNIRDNVLEPWKTDLNALSRFPNTVCKVSGMITEADLKSWTREDLKPYIDHAIENFGFDRLMFGGDWPVCTLAGTYTEWAAALDWALKNYSKGDRKKLLHDNAIRLYQLD
jgi:L-fuconolactonase